MLLEEKKGKQVWETEGILGNQDPETEENRVWGTEGMALDWLGNRVLEDENRVWGNEV